MNVATLGRAAATFFVDAMLAALSVIAGFGIVSFLGSLGVL